MKYFVICNFPVKKIKLLFKSILLPDVVVVNFVPFLSNVSCVLNNFYFDNLNIFVLDAFLSSGKAALVNFLDCID